MTGIILTFPILAGKVEAWRRFCQELSGSKLQMYLASRRRLGITSERMALIETSYSSMAVITVEAPNVAQALEEIIVSHHSFDIWYRKRLQELHGINLSKFEKLTQSKTLPPNQKVYFEWTLNSGNGR